MKLYKESQVKDMFLEWATTNKSRDDIMRDFTPIELPTDEEIEMESEEKFAYKGTIMGFEVGAKWVIEQIKKQK